MSADTIWANENGESIMLEIYDDATWTHEQLANIANSPVEDGPVDFYPANTPA